MTRQAWSKPSLVTHHGGFMNKFGTTRPADSTLQAEMDNVPLLPLIEQYGSPLFVFSEKTLRENVRRLQRSFATRWPVVHHGWSYKTNYLSAICNVFHQEDSWAEVVSELEYSKAREQGVPGSRIIFNGPWKPAPALETAAREGALIHIDHLDEIYELERIGDRLGKAIAVGIRLNFETGYTDTWSRFGFNLESGAAHDAVQRIAASKHLKLTGLHSHIGTFILDVRAYAVQARVMVDFMIAIEQEFGCVIDYLDIGGGFASRNALHGIYLPPEQVTPSFDQYAEAISESLMEATRARVAAGKKLPALFLETGRAVIDDASVLLTTVVGGKRLPDGRRASIVDAGVNTLFTAFWYNHDIKPLAAQDGIPEETVIYGPLCMNIDVIRASIMLPPLNAGDVLAVRPAGAYNNTQWMQFIHSRPAVLMVMENGNVELIRHAEQLDTLSSQEVIPKGLQQPFGKKGGSSGRNNQ